MLALGLVCVASPASADPPPPPAPPAPPAMPRPVVIQAHAPADSPTRILSPVPAPPAAPAAPVSEPYWTQRRFIGLAITGAGLAGVVIGSAFGAERAGETSSASAALARARAASPPAVPTASVCTNPGATGVAPCTALSNALSGNVGDAQVEESLLVGGGVILGLGLITTFWPGGPESPLARLAPMTGPRVAGLQWSASF